MSGPKLCGALSPVPTAVPPAASRYSSCRDADTRLAAVSSWAAHPDHSWPTLTVTKGL
jgi:hypothetical protein